MIRILDMLIDDPSITAISFKQKSFWGDINYISDAIYLRRNVGGWHRIFKWNTNYKYLTHEPPTIIDESGIELRTKHWIKGEMMAKKDIFMYHYSLLFPWQVEQKVKIYQDEKPEKFSESIIWGEKNFLKLGNPFRFIMFMVYQVGLYVLMANILNKLLA
jgi:hypothetical protein